jgi:hypothetical protein
MAMARLAVVRLQLLQGLAVRVAKVGLVGLLSLFLLAVAS